MRLCKLNASRRMHACILTEKAGAPNPKTSNPIRRKTTKQKKQEERERCVAMLQVLGDTLEQEYAQHGGSHWGSEDRRTKMWFIALTRTRLYVFASLVALQIVVTLVKAIVEFKGY